MSNFINELSAGLKHFLDNLLYVYTTWDILENGEKVYETFIPVVNWTLLILFLFVLLFLAYKFARNSSFIVLFEMAFEKIFEFFEDILWKDEKRWVKVYVTSLFFIILTSNLLWVFIEFLLPIFGHDLEHYIIVPTANKNFNIAMAIVWVLVVIYEQFRFLWVPKAIYEYFPILWKNYIPYEFGNKPKIIDIPLFLLVKIFDIVISVFLWLLEIVWHIAKIISLAFRLFWNVTSGWILLWMLVAWLWALTMNMAWIYFPIIWPVIVYFQELLVSLIQALVFPLLLAIFVKVAKVH